MLALTPRAPRDLDHPWREFGHKSHLYPGTEMRPSIWGTTGISSRMYLCLALVQQYLILARNKGSRGALPLERGWEK